MVPHMRFSLSMAATLALSCLIRIAPVPAQEPKEGGEPAKVEPKAADADAPLAEGFPDATRPVQIEIKTYPAYRSAVAEGEGMTIGSGDFLFWFLFRHIESRHVAMTAPVINTYPSPEMLDDAKARGEVSMEFVYPSIREGEAGPGVGTVKVVDHPSQRFVCLGFQGEMTPAALKDGVAKLQAWLDAHSEEWTADGPLRRIGYHGPMTPVQQRLWEVQIPVKALKEAAEEAPGETPEGADPGRPSEASDPDPIKASPA